MAPAITTMRGAAHRVHVCTLKSSSLQRKCTIHVKLSGYMVDLLILSAQITFLHRTTRRNLSLPTVGLIIIIV